MLLWEEHDPNVELAEQSRERDNIGWLRNGFGDTEEERPTNIDNYVLGFWGIIRVFRARLRVDRHFFGGANKRKDHV